MSQASSRSVAVAVPSRRAFLQASVAATGALLLGFRLPLAAATSRKGVDPFAPNAFIRIDRQGAVTLIMPQVEMGQGVYTSIAMILAEELDAQWGQVRVEAAPPSDKLYGNPTFGIQATGNSNSIRAFWMPLRKAGAGARACKSKQPSEQPSARLRTPPGSRSGLPLNLPGGPPGRTAGNIAARE